MQRRELLAAALLASMPGTAVGAIALPPRKINVMLLGFCFSGSYAWDLKVSAHRWLEEERFDLSALVVASESLPVRVFGRLGRVPGHAFVPYGDLGWARPRLKGIDVIVVLGDTRNAAFARAFMRVAHEVRARVPVMVYVTIEPWTLTEPGWTPVPAMESVELRRATSNLADASYALSERPAIERLGKALRDFPSSDLDGPFRELSQTRFDCLAGPVIQLFGKPQPRAVRPRDLIS